MIFGNVGNLRRTEIHVTQEISRAAMTSRGPITDTNRARIARTDATPAFMIVPCTHLWSLSSRLQFNVVETKAMSQLCAFYSPSHGQQVWAGLSSLQAG